MLLVAAVLAVYTYQGIKDDTYQRLYGESEAIYNFLMSVRRVYQKQFLESEIALTDKTVGFLPAHSLPRISQEFSKNWDKRGIRINTASDRPRNPRNQADAGELEAINWFKADDERTVYTRDEESTFLYARPVWVVQSCLKCHGDPADAPPTIRSRYEGAFGYEVGDLRGVVSVRIPMEGMDRMVMGSYMPRFWMLLAAFMMIAVAVYFVVRHLVSHPLNQMSEGVRQIDRENQSYRFTQQKGELGEFVEQFNLMMDRQQQLHAALSEQKEKMEQILSSMEEGVVVIDAEGRIQHINSKMEQWTGWPAITHYGAPIESLFVSWHRDPISRQQRLQSESGEEIPVLVSVGVLHSRMGDENTFEGEVLVIHDNRVQLRAEQQEEYAAFQAGIAEMSTMILHNVGNALSAINGGMLRLSKQVAVIRQMSGVYDGVTEKLERLQGEERPHFEQGEQSLREVKELIHAANHEVLLPLLKEMEEESLQPIERSVQHISEIIRVQQGSARLANKASSFQLYGVIQDALVMQRDTLNKLDVEVVEQFPQRLQELYLPRNQLVQVMNNLLKNSYESIIEQKQREPELRGVIELSVEQQQTQTQITVSDNGMGVDGEKMEEIFAFGYSSKERGSGFGLHASQNFIRSLGGELELRSEGIGQGAVVTLVVPNRLEGEGQTMESIE